MFLSEIKKHASSFIQEKYKTARLALTDVSQAELLAEEATNSDPWGPDARTMTRISEAAFDIDDYWRIVDVMHRRLLSVNYKEWRQSYKSLVLLEFLLTHGPEDLFEEFHCDIGVVRELGEFQFIDERGFNWGACMQKKTERILKFLGNEAQLQEARSKALRISKEIQGFGNLIVSPSSSSSSSASSKISRTLSFGSYYSDSPTWNGRDELSKQDQQARATTKHCEVKNLHLWDNPKEETGSLIGSNTNVDEEENSKTDQTAREHVVGFRSLSNVGKMTEKKIGRQLSLGY